MLQIQSFTFNPFQENTYILYDKTLEAIIFDPGCYSASEQIRLQNFIQEKKLKPVKLINTHCHIDHVFGNAFVAQQYNLELEAHELELDNLKKLSSYGKLWGFEAEESPLPSVFLNEGDKISWGSSELEILFTPGHSAGSLSFFNPQEKLLISGDVLFRLGVGRVDLPGGNGTVLKETIQEKLFLLPDETQVFSGHGPATTIGFEKINNPFVGKNAI